MTARRFHNTSPVALWLFICCGMIFAAAVIGAITRLTESGLSITEWAPVTGALPPLSDAAWHKAFQDYRQIPQYKFLHAGMDLAAFKNIYFWEWLHRLWGRLIGLVYALPFFGFLLRGQIPAGLQGKLWLGLLLGGLQGALGWFMVASGLAERVYVSHIRLALHLALALLIYGYLLWLALDVMQKPGSRRDGRTTISIARHGWFCLALLALTIIGGALVAGLKAGWAYNSFPLMDGVWLPEESWNLQPVWLNFFDNTALVQFCHRWLALGTAVAIWLWCLRLWRQCPMQRTAAMALATMTGLQAALGVVTLLLRAHIVLAALHQAGAILTLTALLLLLHRQKTQTMLLKIRLPSCRE